MSKRRPIWKRWFWGFVAVSIAFFVFRASTEIGQRRSLLPTVYNLFFLPIDQYCAKHGMKWDLLVENRYRYWSTLDFIVAVKDPALKIAKIQAQFECQLFGLSLKKVEIARGDLYLTPSIDVTDDFLSGSMKHYKYYLDQNPLPKPESEYLSSNATPEEFSDFLTKKAQKIESEQNRKSKERVEFELTLIKIFFFGVTIIALWLIWCTFHVWLSIFRKRFRINKQIRHRLIIELLGLPVLVGILIVSMVLADPIGSMPKSFGVVFSLNGFLAFVGSVLYIIHVVSVRKRFRQIARVIKMRLSESLKNEPRAIGLE